MVCKEVGTLTTTTDVFDPLILVFVVVVKALFPDVVVMVESVGAGTVTVLVVGAYLVE